MAMSDTNLASLMASKLATEFGIEENEHLQKMAKAIAEAVIDHIKANAEIKINTETIQVAGSATAQANTAPITISPIPNTQGIV